MAWKPAKPLNGPSSQGRQHAYELDRIGAPFLKRRNGDGSISYKKNGELFTRAAPPDDPELDDGYYCMGRVGGVLRIVGSRTARGKFKDRGAAGNDSFQGANLQFYGRGKGFDIELGTEVTGATNFDGKFYPFVTTTVYTTRNGKSLEPRHTFVESNVAGGTAPRLHPQLTTPFFGWAGTVFKDEAHVPRIYFTGIQVVDGQHQPMLYADPMEKYGDVEVLPTIYTPGQLCAGPIVRVMDLKGKLLLVNKYMRPTYKDSSVNVSLCPGVAFTVSSDHGATWESVATDGMFGDAQSLSFLPVDTNTLTYKPWAFKFNEAVKNASLDVFCTDPVGSKGIAIGMVPAALFVSGAWKVFYRRKIGRYDGFTITESLQLGQSDDYDVATMMCSGPVPLVLNGVQGVAYLNRDVPADMNLIPSTKPTLMWTDGLTTTTLGIMPFVSAFTGAMTGVGPGKIVCPMFDGEHSLYELRDDMTWVKRATISDTAAAASPLNWVLQNFSRLTFLRKDGRPVSATPSAPWMSDSRKSPPT